MQRQPENFVDSRGSRDWCNPQPRPSPATTEVAKAKANMKQLAAVTREKPAHLVTRTLTDITEDARLRLPKEDAASAGSIPGFVRYRSIPEFFSILDTYVVSLIFT